MKKLFIYTLFLLAFTTLFSLTVSADVIPPDSHPLNLCAKVVNLNEFPNIVLIGYISVISGGNEAYQIKNNECLTKGYKFNSLSIYWTTKEKFNLIDLKNLKLSDVTLLLENVNSYGGYIFNSNPLTKEDIEYSIALGATGLPNLYKSKQTSEYNNGTPVKVETFTFPTFPPIRPPLVSEISQVTRTLRFGIRNDNDVKILQTYLNNTGLKITLVVDGSFGPKTQSAVILFQGTYQLTPDGIVGPKTRGQMIKLLQ